MYFTMEMFANGNGDNPSAWVRIGQTDGKFTVRNNPALTVWYISWTNSCFVSQNLRFSGYLYRLSLT